MKGDGKTGTEATLWSVIRVLAGLLKPNFPLVILWSMFPTTGVPKGWHSIAGQKVKSFKSKLTNYLPQSPAALSSYGERS